MELFFRDLPELVEPAVDLFHPIDFQFIKDLPAILFFSQEVAFGQDAQVFGYGLAGDVEVLRDGVGGHGLHGDEDEDRPSGGVCNGLKNVASHGFLLRSRLVAKICEADRFRKFFFNWRLSQAMAARADSRCIGSGQW